MNNRSRNQYQLQENRDFSNNEIPRVVFNQVHPQSSFVQQNRSNQEQQVNAMRSDNQSDLGVVNSSTILSNIKNKKELHRQISTTCGFVVPKEHDMRFPQQAQIINCLVDVLKWTDLDVKETINIKGTSDHNSLWNACLSYPRVKRALYYNLKVTNDGATAVEYVKSPRKHLSRLLANIEYNTWYTNVYKPALAIFASRGSSTIPNANVVVRQEFIQNFDYNVAQSTSNGNTGSNIMRQLSNSALLQSNPEFRSSQGEFNQNAQRHSSRISVKQFINTGVIKTESNRQEDMSKEELIMRMRQRDEINNIGNNTANRNTPNQQPVVNRTPAEQSVVDNVLLLLSDIGFDNIDSLGLAQMDIRKIRVIRQALDESLQRFSSLNIREEQRDILVGQVNELTMALIQNFN